MPSLAEIRRALHGAWRLLLLDPHGILEFDGSVGGGLRSFWAALLVIPLDVASLALPPAAGGGEEHGILLDLLPQLAVWPVLLLLIFALVRWYGRGERYWLFLAAYNWTQVLQAVGMLLFGGLTAAAGGMVDLTAPASASGPSAVLGGVAVLLALIIYAVVVAYEWYVAWISLDSGFALPTVVLLLDLVLGIGIGRLTTAFT